VLFAGDAIASNPHLYKGLSYDVFRDLAPVSLLARGVSAIRCLNLCQTAHFCLMLTWLLLCTP